jgi:RNA polymerase sigma-70 factor (ECF subfamily)
LGQKVSDRLRARMEDNRSPRWFDGLTVSEETSLSLLARAQKGDAVAMEALMGRYLTRLQRWARGRLPASARSLLDTDDLVQETLLSTLRRLPSFTPRHDGALLAFLREAMANKIRNEIRRGPSVMDGSIDLDSFPSSAPSPIEQLVSRQGLDRYEHALQRLDEDDRAAIVGRLEMGYSFDALARAMGRPSADAARKHTSRALQRLVTLLQSDGA